MIKPPLNSCSTPTILNLKIPLENPRSFYFTLSLHKIKGVFKRTRCRKKDIKRFTLHKIEPSEIVMLSFCCSASHLETVTILYGRRFDFRYETLYFTKIGLKLCSKLHLCNPRSFSEIPADHLSKVINK